MGDHGKGWGRGLGKARTRESAREAGLGQYWKGRGRGQAAEEWLRGRAEGRPKALAKGLAAGGHRRGRLKNWPEGELWGWGRAS